MISFDLPIYYTVERKTKPNSTHLLSDNWVRNLHSHLKNVVKQHYHTLVAEAVLSLPLVPYTTFDLHMDIHYKSTNCDASNIAHQIEKFALDGLKAIAVITDDNVKYHLTSSWAVAGQDKLNPRCTVTVTPKGIT